MVLTVTTVQSQISNIKCQISFLDMANLLIVDDELSMRQFLTHLFQREGHSIRVAENGKAAMAQLRQQAADVIISDVRMPDMGGIELLRAARDLYPDVEVIVMTAFDK